MTIIRIRRSLNNGTVRRIAWKAGVVASTVFTLAGGVPTIWSVAQTIPPNPVVPGVSGATTYRAAVLAAGPVVYWPLDEVSGPTASDIAGAPTSGTYSTSTLFGQASLPTIGTGVKKVVGGPIVSAQLAGLSPTGPTSIEFWSKGPVGTPDFLARVGDFGIWRGTVYNGVQLGATGLPLIQYDVIDIDREVWRHYALTFDGAKSRLFVDGVRRAEAPLASIGLGDSKLVVGESADRSYDEIAWYSKALSEAQVREHYALGLEGHACESSAAPGYASTVLGDGAAGFWRPAGGARTSFDVVGCRNMAMEASVSTPGVRGSSPAFLGGFEVENGVARGTRPHTASLGDAGLSETGPLSLEFWSRGPVGSIAPMVRIGNFGVYRNEIYTGWFLGATGVGNIPFEEIDIHREVWRHYVLTFNGSRSRLFVDGLLRREQPSTAIDLGDKILYANESIGRGYADLAFYKKELSPVEVRRHYSVGLEGTECAPSTPQSAYGAAVLGDQAIGYWPIAAGRRTTFDLAGCRNMATEPGAAPTESPLSGDLRGIIAGPRASGATLTDAGLAGGVAPLTLEFWSRGDPVGSIAPMVRLGDFGLRRNEIYTGWFLTALGIGNIGTEELNFYGAAWRHYVLSFDGVMVRLYVDGVLIRQGPSNPIDLRDRALIVGESVGRGYAHVAVYNKVLTQAEALNHFSLGTRVATLRPTATKMFGTAFQSGVSSVYKAASAWSRSIADPVNSATGAFVHSEIDLSTSSERGLPFGLTRTYDSRVTSGLFGPGWGHEYAEKVAVDASTGVATWSNGSGGTVDFAPGTAPGSYVAPQYVSGQLEGIAGGGWTLGRTTQIKSIFDVTGRIVGQVDRSGQGLTFAYDASNRLSTVTDAAGRIHTFTYGAGGVSAGKLIRVQSPDGRFARYTYATVAGQVRLASFIDVRAKASTMTYDANGFLVKIVDPLGNSEATNTFDAIGRVVSQADALGKISTFVYDDVAETVSFTDAAGALSTFDHGGAILDASTSPSGSIAQTYDDALNVTAYSDEAGKVWNATYDARGNMLSRTDPLGRVESWTYDAMNNVLAAIDVTGVATTSTYDGAGRILTQVRGVSSSAWAWNADGTLASVTDALGRSTTYAYDASGNRVSETTPGGAVTTWEYDSANRVSRVVPPRGNVVGANPAAFDTQYRYDKAGNVVLVSAPGGQNTRSVYDDAGRLVTETAADGGVTAYGYNAAGEVVTVTAPDGGVTSFTYSDRGEKLTQTDPVGAVTKWLYDPAGRMVSMIEPEGNASGATPANYTWTYGYDNLGRQTTVTDPLGRVTTRTYDSAGRMIAESRPDGSTTTTFDPVLGERKVTTTDQIGRSTVANTSPEGWMSSTVDGKGHVTSFGYDNVGNRTSMLQADGSLTTWAYDVENRVVSTVSPRGNVLGASPAEYTTTYTYDLEGRQVAATDPLGRVTSTTYDVAGRTDIVTDPAAKVTNYAYDVMGRVKQVNATALGATKYAYAANGTLTTRTDALGKVTTYEYDLAHRLTKQTDPLGRFKTHGYDLNGRKTSMVDGVANLAGNPALGTTTFGYDSLGRVVSKSFSDGTPTVAYSYDSAGRVASMADGTGTSTYTYDAANRVTAVTNGAGVVMTYGWDANNNLTAFSDGQQSSTRTHDVLDRLVGVADAGGLVVGYGYDPDGNLTVLNYPGGTSQVRTVDRAGQLGGLANTTATGLLRSYSYTRDAVGSPTRISVAGPAGVIAAESQVMEYDGAGRLRKQCWTGTACAGQNQTLWTYDLLGRRATERVGTGVVSAYAYDSGDQLTSITQGANVKSFAYNGNGDQTLSAGVVSTFNAAGQTVSVAVAGGTVSYGYDGARNRTSSTVGGVTTRFDWDTIGSGLPSVAAESVGGVVTRKYTYGHDVVRITTGATNSIPLVDPVGTVTHLVSPSGGVQAQYLTGAYGVDRQTVVVDPAVASNPIRFTGQYTDPVTGLVHLRARNYNPASGSFTQTDPMPYGAGTSFESPYVYGRNLPTAMSDPSGLRAIYNRFLTASNPNLSPIDLLSDQFKIDKARWLFDGTTTSQCIERMLEYVHYSDDRTSAKAACDVGKRWVQRHPNAAGYARVGDLFHWFTAVTATKEFGDSLGAALILRNPYGATNTPRPGAAYSKMYDGGGGVIAEVDGKGVLNLAIEAAPGSPRGGQMFNQALSEVGPVSGVRGTWNPSMPSNLDAFNANIRAGMSVEQAARSTFTGTMAGRAGFTNVTVEQLTGSPGAYTNVKVVFGK